MPWKGAELEWQFGSHYAQMIKSAQGSSSLKAADSIMRYDVPGSFTTDGKDIRAGGHGQLDTEATTVLRSLYPPLLEAYSFRASATQLPGFVSGWDGRTSGKMAYNMAQTSNIVTGIVMMDMGLNGNFRLNSGPSNIRPGSGYTIEMGAWADTHLIEAKCNVLSFLESDQRVRTGRIEYNQLGGGLQRSVRVNFPRPFSKTPSVVIFISSLDAIKGKQIRLNTAAINIDANGFTALLETWAGKYFPSVSLTHLLPVAQPPIVRPCLSLPQNCKS